MINDEGRNYVTLWLEPSSSSIDLDSAVDFYDEPVSGEESHSASYDPEGKNHHEGVTEIE